MPLRRSSVEEAKVSAVQEVLQCNQRLLDCIARGDWAVYQELCDPTLTAFEPEGLGHLVEGMGFHRFYFDQAAPRGAANTTMSQPHVRLMGDVAVVAYTRLNQRWGADGTPITTGFLETRVWQRQDGNWKHVHFHRSALSPT